jgi:hypothetical protein
MLAAMSEAEIATLYEEVESIRFADALYWQRQTCGDEASTEYRRRQRRLVAVKRELTVLEHPVR